MTREQALTSLLSAVPSERLSAARYLQFWALPGDIPVLRDAIAKESVGWVRRALESALQRLGDKQIVTVDLDQLRQEDSETSADVAAIARARVARTVVHELEPIVGVIEYYASNEFTGYEASRTKHHVERLAAMLRAIETLGKITSTPSVEPVDIARLLTELIESERTVFDVDIRVEGPIRLVLSTDAGLLRLIVSNGIRNACESVVQVYDRPTTVAVIYGATDRDAWITIADNGIGLPSGSSENLFEMGRSTKEDHLGMGLTLSYEAAKALGGELRLVMDSASTRLEMMLPLLPGSEK